MRCWPLERGHHFSSSGDSGGVEPGDEPELAGAVVAAELDEVCASRGLFALPVAAWRPPAETRGAEAMISERRFVCRSELRTGDSFASLVSAVAAKLLS